jgi:hypothetical protein
VYVIAIRCPPLRLGDCLSFYRTRREQFTCVPHYSPTCGGVASSATKLTAIMANPAPVGASWSILCLYRSSFEGGGVVVSCPPAARGPVRGCRQRGGPYAAQWRSWRRPVPVHSNSVRDVVTVLGVALQGQGWSHRADNDEEVRSRRPDVTA